MGQNERIKRSAFANATQVRKLPLTIKAMEVDRHSECRQKMGSVLHFLPKNAISSRFIDPMKLDSFLAGWVGTGWWVQRPNSHYFKICLICASPTIGSPSPGLPPTPRRNRLGSDRHPVLAVVGQHHPLYMRRDSSPTPGLTNPSI